MEEWQRTTRDFYGRVWTERRTSGSGPGSSPAREWYELSARINTDLWIELLARLAPGKRLLECGGATGRLTARLAASGWECTQIDITREGPVLARERFAAEGVKGLFATADVRRLPFRDASFDVVTSHGLLDLMPDIDAPIGEMSRVLKPNGLFVASFFPKRFSVQSLADSGIRAARGVGSLVSGRRGASRSDDLPTFGNVFRNSYPLDVYLAACREAGLTGLVGKGIWPFPMLLSLPDPVMRGYLWLGRTFEPQWRAFNRSNSPWTAKWGAMLAVHGTKRADA
jgi:SAM-dependent methyltransferase